MRNDISDRDDQHGVGLCEIDGMLAKSQSPIRIHGFAQHAGWFLAGEPHELALRLGVPPPASSSPGMRTKGKDVAGPSRILRPRIRFRGRTDRRDPID